MTDLHKRAEAIAAGMTKGPWKPILDANGAGHAQASGPYHAVPDGEMTDRQWNAALKEVRRKAEADATGIVLLANLRHEMLAALKAARKVIDKNNGDVTYDCHCHKNTCRMCLDLKEWKTARNALDAALARELGETP